MACHATLAVRRRRIAASSEPARLEYGREQYLPDKLRDYVLARDLCRVPGCTARGTSRLQMDHALPFPDGSTSTANCGGLCTAHHQQKTARLADLHDSDKDGSGTWITQWGQRITIPPRPFLHDPADQQPPTRAQSPDDEPPDEPRDQPGASPQPRRPRTSPPGFDARELDQPDDPPF